MDAGTAGRRRLICVKIHPLSGKLHNCAATQDLASRSGLGLVARECKTCSMADACTKAYFKATLEAQSATKQATRDWKQNLDKKASAELSNRGALALQDAMETQVRSELERLKECLAKIR